MADFDDSSCAFNTIMGKSSAMTRDELREKIRAAALHFTEEVSAIFGEAFASVAAEFRSGPMAASTTPKKPTPAPKPIKAAKPQNTKTTVVKPAAKTPTTAKKKPVPSKRIRRSANELGRVGEEVVKLLSTAPEPMRIEEINKRLGTTTRQLMRPIQKLISDGQIKKEGEPRATIYFL